MGYGIIRVEGDRFPTYGMESLPWLEVDSAMHSSNHLLLTNGPLPIGTGVALFSANLAGLSTIITYVDIHVAAILKLWKRAGWT